MHCRMYYRRAAVNVYSQARGIRAACQMHSGHVESVDTCDTALSFDTAVVGEKNGGPHPAWPSRLVTAVCQKHRALARHAGSTLTPVCMYASRVCRAPPMIATILCSGVCG